MKRVRVESDADEREYRGFVAKRVKELDEYHDDNKAGFDDSFWERYAMLQREGTEAEWAHQESLYKALDPDGAKPEELATLIGYYKDPDEFRPMYVNLTGEPDEEQYDGELDLTED